MSGEEDKIYADESQPATLIDGDRQIECETLGKAVIALDNLLERERASQRSRSGIGSSPLPRLIGCITARPDPLERAAGTVPIDRAAVPRSGSRDWRKAAEDFARLT
jgi:hypothetical protein